MESSGCNEKESRTGRFDRALELRRPFCVISSHASPEQVAAYGIDHVQPCASRTQIAVQVASGWVRIEEILKNRHEKAGMSRTKPLQGPRKETRCHRDTEAAPEDRPSGFIPSLPYFRSRRDLAVLRPTITAAGKGSNFSRVVSRLHSDSTFVTCNTVKARTGQRTSLVLFPVATLF